MDGLVEALQASPQELPSVEGEGLQALDIRDAAAYSLEDAKQKAEADNLMATAAAKKAHLRQYIQQVQCCCTDCYAMKSKSRMTPLGCDLHKRDGCAACGQLQNNCLLCKHRPERKLSVHTQSASGAVLLRNRPNIVNECVSNY